MTTMIFPVSRRAPGPRRPITFFTKAAVAVALAVAAATGIQAADQTAWPEIKTEARPWAFWWWPGSAVDTANITHQLETFHEAGMGGVHIIPIYGAQGAESNYISYLSPQWMRMMGHTVAEAKRLGMGVDMTTGTGWCFGGPQVSDDDANADVVVKTFPLGVAERVSEKFDRKAVQAAVAFGPDGRAIEVTDSISADGEVNFSPPGNWIGTNAPPKTWTVYVVSQKPSGQKVKRPAPGGEGWMLNLIYNSAMGRFLKPFDEAFAKYNGAKPRAQYHDSYEYRSDWSPDFFAQFEKRRGYKLQNELPALFDVGSRETEHGTRFSDPDHRARVLCDYRQTVSEIMADSLREWTKWSHDHGFITRDQAHGSPGNLLDLYADADIPETEMFHSDRSVLVSKFASSAAHVTGKNLTSAETGTWLEEHFTEKLADLKYLADDMFLSGINHVFYHGTCYSPDGIPWPGWLFYASTEMNPRNSIWHDVRELNDYIARCQSVLQSGKPDNDVLLYWPLHDYWSTAPGMLPHLKIHGPEWFDQQSIGKAAKELQRLGYSFDYVSDRQLQTGKVREGDIRMPGGDYKVVVVPECNLMPLETFEQLLGFAEKGGTVIFENHLPTDVPGAGDLQKRRAEFSKLSAKLSFSARPTSQGKVEEAKLGKGHVLRRELAGALPLGNASVEEVSRAGLSFVRRSFNDGWNYFIANRGATHFDGWVELARPAKSVLLLDPLTGTTGVAAMRQNGGHLEVHLQLEGGESLIVRALEREQAAGARWNYWQTKGTPVEITGDWLIQFITGGPVLPADLQIRHLASWTTLSQDAQSFGGTAKYMLRFDAPQVDANRKDESHDSQSKQSKSGTGAETFYLDLGTVCQSARVRLNGKDYGTLITPPFRVVVDNLDAKDNVLEVEVTNVSANRIRDLDRRGVKWKIMRDINIVNINYKPFDASNWPLYDSGLLGPVTLTPVQ